MDACEPRAQLVTQVLGGPVREGAIRFLFRRHGDQLQRGGGVAVRQQRLDAGARSVREMDRTELGLLFCCRGVENPCRALAAACRGASSSPLRSDRKESIASAASTPGSRAASATRRRPGSLGEPMRSRSPFATATSTCCSSTAPRTTRSGSTRSSPQGGRRRSAAGCPSGPRTGARTRRYAATRSSSSTSCATRLRRSPGRVRRVEVRYEF